MHRQNILPALTKTVMKNGEKYVRNGDKKLTLTVDD